ncbi:MAG: maleylpyruvate isomerase family mycothiol-dependent enzyme [Candidatus Dormibacteria bacterium]
MSSPSDDTVAELRGVWSSIAELGSGMDDRQWQSPTGCPGWEVRDLVAHMVGTELSLAGENPPAAPAQYPAHVLNEIGKFNERWVLQLRELGRGQLLERFGEITAARLQALEALTEAEWSAPSWTPAGPGTYRDFMRIRVFDCWAHEQDIRWVLAQPGGTEGPWVETALGIPRATLPRLVAKTARAPEGSVVEWLLEGEPERRWRVAVRDGRGVEATEGDGEPSVRLHCSVADFVMRVCGRVDPVSGDRLGRVAVEGDEEVGRRLVERMALPV